MEDKRVAMSKGWMDGRQARNDGMMIGEEVRYRRRRGPRVGASRQGACRRKAGHDDLRHGGERACAPRSLSHRMNGHLNSPRIVVLWRLVLAAAMPYRLPYQWEHALCNHVARRPSSNRPVRGSLISVLVGTNSKSQSFLHALLLRAAIIACYAW